MCHKRKDDNYNSLIYKIIAAHFKCYTSCYTFATHHVRSRSVTAGPTQNRTMHPFFAWHQPPSSIRVETL